tara:strand:- start:2592 stop:3629 length:1038 start_codon:yes stop_codon:yes gene_type:complete
MLITYVRSSSYNNYDYCQMQYFITYVLGWRSTSGKKADMGTMAHKVMEILAGLKKFQQDNPRKKYLVIDDDKCGKVRIKKEELYTDEFVDDITKLAIEKYAEGSTHKFYRKERQVVRDTVETFLTHSDGMFDPRKRNIYHPEAQFDIPIEEDWAKFEYEINGETVKGQLAIKGTIDLTTLVSEDTIEVVDWKTGRRMDWATGEVKDYKKLENDPQLLLYFYAISKVYPQFKYRIMSIFFYKDKEGEVDPKPFSICLDKTDEDKFLGMLKKRFEEIKKNITPKPIDPTRNNFKCKYLCHFCKNNFEGKDENMCITIEKALKKDGMEKVVEKYTAPGFNIGFYEAPG